MLSLQARKTLSKQIERLRSTQFDDGEVHRILVGLREELPADSILRDLADFIHADRTKGPCWEHVSRFHACCSMIAGEVRPALEAVPKNIFEFCVHALFETPKEELKVKVDARKDLVMRDLKSRYRLDRHAQVYRLHGRIRTETLESLLWISGVLRVRPAFKQEPVIAQLSGVLDEIEPGSKQVVEANKEEIVLCLLALLHQTRFLLYGGAIGETSVATAFDLDLKRDFASADVVVPTGGSKNWSWSFSLFQTELKAEEYFEPILFEKVKESRLGANVAVQVVRTASLRLALA